MASDKHLRAKIDDAKADLEQAAADWLDKYAAGWDTARAEAVCQEAEEALQRLESDLRSKKNKKRKKK